MRHLFKRFIGVIGLTSPHHSQTVSEYQIFFHLLVVQLGRVEPLRAVELASIAKAMAVHEKIQFKCGGTLGTCMNVFPNIAGTPCNGRVSLTPENDVPDP